MGGSAPVVSFDAMVLHRALYSSSASGCVKVIVEEHTLGRAKRLNVIMKGAAISIVKYMRRGIV
jgi:hypothetical protein